MRAIGFAFLIVCTCLVGCVSADKIDRNAASEFAPTNEVVVAIFGDIHEDFRSEEQLLSQIKAAGATYLIGMGDFIEFGGLEKLESALSKLTPLSGIPKNNIYLCPGNWEQTLNEPADVNSILNEYGHQVVADYDRAEKFGLLGFVLRAGHFPQHQVPKVLLPPLEYVHSIEGQITLVETLIRNSEPDSSVNIELFAHTHVAGIYFDQKVGVWSLNPGVIEAGRKRATEPQAYVLWFMRQNTIRFVNLLDGQTLREVHLDDPNESCKKAPCVFWKK